MIYQFKLPGLYTVDAQTAGEEMERIYEKYGTIKPADVVDESRPKSAPLHDVFEWRDKIAAEKYREQQAADLIRAIEVRVQDTSGEEIVTRAIVSVNDEYKPMHIVVKTRDDMDVLLQNAFREMESFKRKYQTLNQLAPVFAAIDNVTRAAG